MIRDIREGNKFEYVARRGAFWRALLKWKKIVIPKTTDPSKQNYTGKEYHLTQMEEEMVKTMEEKLSHGGLEITVRLVSAAQNQEKARLNLENIINAFSQYNIYRYGNSFSAAIPRNQNKLVRDFIYRSPHTAYMVVNTEEMASLWHLPVPHT